MMGKSMHFLSTLLMMLGLGMSGATQAGTLLGVLRQPPGGRATLLQVFAPPEMINGDTGAQRFGDVRIDTAEIRLDAGDIDQTAGDELVLAVKNPARTFSLYAFRMTADGDALAFQQIAGDSSIGRNVRYMAVGQFDGDSAKEVVVVKEKRNGTYKLLVLDLPGRIGGNARVIARDRQIGGNLLGVTAYDADGDGVDEVALVRGQADGTADLEIYSPPASRNDDLGVPIERFPLGAGVIDVVLADFDDDGVRELALARRVSPGGPVALEIREISGAPEDPLPVSLSDPDIGPDVAALLALHFGSSQPPGPANSVPTAIIDADPMEGSAPLEVTLDGRLSRDPDGFIQHYRWEFHDGSVSESAWTRYTYDSPGVYPVGLTVTDNQGAEATTWVQIRVTAPAGNDSGLSARLQEVVDLINQVRLDHGLSPLNVDSALMQAAGLHTQDMAEHDFFSHTGSDGSSPFDRMRQAGYPLWTGGENIAAGYTTPQAVVDAWMNSAGHRANLLNGNFCDLGVGYVSDSTSRFRHYWTLNLACKK